MNKLYHKLTETPETTFFHFNCFICGLKILHTFRHNADEKKRMQNELIKYSTFEV